MTEKSERQVYCDPRKVLFRFNIDWWALVAKQKPDYWTVKFLRDYDWDDLKTLEGQKEGV
jgi:hypothetical protein